MDLYNFLIAPIQRITRYCLILKGKSKEQRKVGSKHANHLFVWCRSSETLAQESLIGQISEMYDLISICYEWNTIVW
jgi:hypothetical protein